MRHKFNKSVAVLFKLVIAAFLCLVWHTQDAKASVSNMVAQLGVYNTTDTTYGLEVDNNNAFHFSLSGSSIFYPTNDQTTNTTMTVNQSGQVTVFGGTSNHTQFTLPTATPGMDYYFVASQAKTFSILIQSGDLIDFSSETTGKGIANSSGAQGDEIELFCNLANHWEVKDKLGNMGRW